MSTRQPRLQLSGDPSADELISENPFALLVGLVLDQQVPLEWAFRGPYLLQERLGVPLDAKAVAATEPERLRAIFSEKPALHRFPAAMADRVHALAETVVNDYGGQAEQIWSTASSAHELVEHLRRLPGFGDYKAKMFVALLGKQLGVQPEGWREASHPFGEEGVHRSIADIISEETRLLVRAYKAEMKKLHRHEKAG